MPPFNPIDRDVKNARRLSELVEGAFIDLFKYPGILDLALNIVEEITTEAKLDDFIGTPVNLDDDDARLVVEGCIEEIVRSSVEEASVGHSEAVLLKGNLLEEVVAAVSQLTAAELIEAQV